MDKDLKLMAIHYMGGCCALCGYHKCLRSLHLHHLNPHQKDFEISQATSWGKVLKELQKCILLCANCHAEVHSGYIDHEVLAELAER